MRGACAVSCADVEGCGVRAVRACVCIFLQFVELYALFTRRNIGWMGRKLPSGKGEKAGAEEE